MAKQILIIHLVRFGANIRYSIINLKVSFKEYLSQEKVFYRLDIILQRFSI